MDGLAEVAEGVRVDHDFVGVVDVVLAAGAVLGDAGMDTEAGVGGADAEAPGADRPREGGRGSTQGAAEGFAAVEPDVAGEAVPGFEEGGVEGVHGGVWGGAGAVGMVHVWLSPVNIRIHKAVSRDGGVGYGT